MVVIILIKIIKHLIISIVQEYFFHLRIRYLLKLLVILIPAEAEADGGDGGIALLALLTTLHIGTAILAIMRQAPSLAGATVLLPWTWVLLQEFVVESFRTVMISNGWTDPGNVIELASTPFAAYLIVSVVLNLIVNMQL